MLILYKLTIDTLAYEGIMTVVIILVIIVIVRIQGVSIILAILIIILIKIEGKEMVTGVIADPDIQYGYIILVQVCMVF